MSVLVTRERKGTGWFFFFFLTVGGGVEGSRIKHYRLGRYPLAQSTLTCSSAACRIAFQISKRYKNGTFSQMFIIELVDQSPLNTEYIREQNDT